MQAIIGFIILINLLYIPFFLFSDSLVNEVEELNLVEIVAIEKHDYIDGDVLDEIENRLAKTNVFDVSITLEDALDDNSLVEDYQFKYSEHTNGLGNVTLNVMLKNGTELSLECFGIDKKYYRANSAIAACETSPDFHQLFISKYL